MQSCGFTNKGCCMVLGLLEFNDNLQIFDIRNNGCLPQNKEIVKSIVAILSARHGSDELKVYLKRIHFF